jgi:uncharacterized membrane protein YgdD (TMEM256/DUF423 family)
MILALAALSAAMAIAAGAFGAHAAATPQAAEWLRTGGTYQLVHAIAILALVRLPGVDGRSLDKPSILLLIGSLIFAGTLYAMAFGAPRWFGAITPIGGSLLILGWLWAAFSFWNSRA